jgi:hypothetical protein
VRRRAVLSLGEIDVGTKRLVPRRPGVTTIAGGSYSRWRTARTIVTLLS